MVSFIRVFLLTVLAVSGLSTAAHASAEYRVWYFDDNFNEDVRVWLGKPGCSESLGIECSDNSQSFPHESGGSYMEINTNYGYSWINDEGGWPTCGNCVGPDDRSVRAIDRLGKDVAALLPALRAQVIRRRAVYLLADLEPSVRALEDAALANLHDASQLVSSCMAQGEARALRGRVCRLHSRRRAS
jgi:hypothetical protein